MFVAIPLVWYVLFHVADLILRHCFHGSAEMVAIVFFATSTVLVMMAFLRLLYFLYSWLSEKPWGTTALTAASGLLFPVLGLLLNIKIPFPCDFQSAGIYVLAVLNGLVLIVPLPRHAGLAALTWWARSALYMFTLYFFIVFLPFMPLSLLAMLAGGAGFLILAPTVLFVIHTRRLEADATALASHFGRLSVLILFLAGLATLPAVFAGRAYLDRQALTDAMNAVFSPDLRQSRVSLNARAVACALDGLRNMKDGIYLPFLTDAYNQFVFEGMVLPDDKMETLSRALLGKPAPRPEKSDRFSLFLAPRSLTHWGGANRALPPRNVTLRPPVLDAHAASNGVARSTVKLELANAGPANSEFEGTLTLPDGVLVSGFWLDVAGKRKPGSIVERKTALWVYHMIRDYTRRDPGLLVDEGNGSLKLSVFPFASNETRTVWIEFMGPATLAPTLTINSTSLQLAPEQHRPTVNSEPSAVCLVAKADAAVVPGAALNRMPRTTRTPIVRFILDRSAAATNAVAIPPALCEAATRLGGRCRVTFANLESDDADLGAQSPDKAAKRALAPADLPAVGGFAPDRAIARRLLDVPAGGATVPIFVVIPAPGSTPVKTLDLRPFGRLTPDVPAYYLWSTDHLDRVSWVDGSVQPAAGLEPPAPVVLFRAAGQTTAIPPEAASALIDLQGWPGRSAGGQRARSLEVYDPDTGAFTPLPIAPVPLADSTYATGLRLLLDSRTAQCDPASLDDNLPDLVERSRMAGILCPFTSYIVVENTAQEKTLSARQKQALKAHHALEFEESVKSPEPGVLWLLPVALLLVWRLRRSRAAQ